MKLKFLVLGMIFILIALTLSINAQAVSLEGGFSGEAYQQETLVREFTLCNTDDASRVLELKAVGENSSWISIGQESSAYGARECRETFAFITPHPYARTETYEIQLVINDEQTYSNFFNLTVLQGHTATLSINPSSQNASQCEAKSYQLTIRNTGRFNETVVLEAEGIPSNWAEFSQNNFSLSRGASKTVNLTVQAPCNQELNDYDFEITVSLDSTDFSVSQNASIEIENGQVIEIISPSSTNACIDTETRASISFKNTGRIEDSIRIELVDAPAWIKLSQTALALEENETKTVQLIALKTNADLGTFSPTIKVASTKFNTSYEKQIDVLLQDCFDAVIEKISGKEETCIEDSLEWEFEITNTGEQAANFIVSASGVNASLNKNSLVLSPGQKEVIKASFDLSNETVAQKAFTLTIDSENFSTQKSYQINLLNCYDAKIELPSLNLCRGVEEESKMIIENTGTMNQSYNVAINPGWISPKETSISVNAGERKEIELLAKTPSDNVAQTIKAVVSNEKIKMEKEKEIMLKTDAQCFGLSLSTDSRELDINLSEGKKITIKITNNGVIAQNISVFASQEPWIFFNPKELSIEPSSSKEVFVYFAPPIDFELEQKTVQIRAKSEKGLQDSLSLNLKFNGAKKILSIPIESVKILQIEENKATIEFSVRNDSESNLMISKISSTENIASFNFDERSIPPQTTQSIQATIEFAEKPSGETIIPLDIETNQGKLGKILTLSFEETSPAEQPGTGLAFISNPFWAGVFIAAIVIVLIIGYLVNRKLFAEQPLQESSSMVEETIEPKGRLSKRMLDLKKQVVGRTRRKKTRTVKRTHRRSFKKFRKRRK